MTSTSSEQLLGLAITRVDRGQRGASDCGEAIAELHQRGEPQTFEIAARLCDDPSPARRILGAELLGQLGPPGARVWAAKSCAILCRLLRDEEAGVVEMAAFALGHLGVESAAGALGALAHSRAESIRHGVAFALACLQAPASASVLLDLMDDPSEVVRDWATTGIADLEADTPDIREGLLARIDDPDPATRAEAFRGLASRRDRRALAGLCAALEEGREPEWTYQEAARAFLDCEEEDPAVLLRLLRDLG